MGSRIATLVKSHGYSSEISSHGEGLSLFRANHRYGTTYPRSGGHVVQFRERLRICLGRDSTDENNPLHVLNPLTLFNYVRADGFDYEKSQQKERERREDVEKIFDEYCSKEAARDREIKTVIEAGDPAEKILEYTESRGVDHIVMGSRGRSGMTETLLGSVAKGVVKRSSVPVTIVP